MRILQIALVRIVDDGVWGSVLRIISLLKVKHQIVTVDEVEQRVSCYPSEKCQDTCCQEVLTSPVEIVLAQRQSTNACHTFRLHELGCVHVRTCSQSIQSLLLWEWPKREVQCLDIWQ